MTSTQSPQQQLIRQHQGLVRSLAWKIHHRMPAHIEFDDLVSYGQIGLAEAARDFDPSRGTAFSTFAYFRIRGAIYDGVASMSWHSRTHYRNVRFQQMADAVLSLEGGRQHEEADEGVEGDVQWFKQITGTLAVVYLASGVGDEDESSMDVADPSAPSPPAVAIDRETNARLRRLIDNLPKESGQLIRGVYYEGLTLQDAGKQIGISKAWASRLHARILGRLARALREVEKSR